MVPPVYMISTFDSSDGCDSSMVSEVGVEMMDEVKSPARKHHEGSNLIH